MVIAVERTPSVVLNHLQKQLGALGYKDGDRVFVRGFYPKKSAKSDARNAEFVLPEIPVDTLEEWQQDGRGIYVVVNSGGHKDSEITSCRAIFYEHDYLNADELARFQQWFPVVVFPKKEQVEPGEPDQWICPKEVQKQLWEKLGLPQPTMQVDTGGKSIHTYWTFSDPVSQEAWRAIQADLLEFSRGDSKLKNPSRVMRLAGCLNASSGSHSLIVAGCGKTYSYEELRGKIPASSGDLGVKPMTWAEFNKSFRLPIDDSVPLETCLSKRNRQLLNAGESNGSRNSTAFQLATDLIGTSQWLRAEGQRFSGDEYDMFIDFCHRCTPGDGWNQHEWEAIWKSAISESRNATLSPEYIENCIKAWAYKNCPKPDALGIEKTIKGFPASTGSIELESPKEDATDEEKLLIEIKNYVKVSDTGSRFQLFPLRSKIMRQFGISRSEIDELAREIELGEAGDLTHSSDSLISAFDEIEVRASSGYIPGIMSGFLSLDSMTQGFQNSDLIIAAGRPSMGKSAFLTNVARNASAISQKPIAIFSLEMSKIQIAYRLLSAETLIESSRLRSGKIYQNEWDRLNHAIAKLASLPIFIDDTAGITVQEVKKKARRLRAEQGDLGLIMIDYLQLMTGSGENRIQEISKVSRALKGLAKELDVPVIALAQLSRAVESRQNKRPMMSDIRETGQAEQDADLIMMLYREEYYEPDTPDRGIAEIIISKHRNGPTGTIQTLFEPQFSRFRNLSTVEEED